MTKRPRQCGPEPERRRPRWADPIVVASIILAVGGVPLASGCRKAEAPPAAVTAPAGAGAAVTNPVTSDHAGTAAVTVKPVMLRGEPAATSTITVQPSSTAKPEVRPVIKPGEASAVPATVVPTPPKQRPAILMGKPAPVSDPVVRPVALPGTPPVLPLPEAKAAADGTEAKAGCISEGEVTAPAK